MGYLIEGPRPTGRPIPAFLDALRELGYIEGQNLIIDYRDGQSDRLPELAVGLVRSKLDLIAAVGTQEVLALKGATVSEGELLRK